VAGLSGQDLGDAIWLALAAVAPHASSIKVRGGVITVGSSLRPECKSTMELREKSALGESGGLNLARILSESATPSFLTALDIGCDPNNAQSKIVLHCALQLSLLRLGLQGQFNRRSRLQSFGSCDKVHDSPCFY
jgi:hypothetical protein